MTNPIKNFPPTQLAEMLRSSQNPPGSVCMAAADVLDALGKRPRSAVMDAELGRQHKVLDKGFIRVVDYMGNEAAICQSARVSYGSGTKTVNEDRGLIRYLMRHRHTTPFEMCELKIHVKLPVFVARQWIRHRTANVNEYSARYSILDNEFYIPAPGDIQPQSQSNKQGREGEFDPDIRWAMLETIRQHSEGSYQLYDELRTGWPWFDENGEMHSEAPDDIKQERDGTDWLQPHNEDHGMAREMARMVLPPNIYTQWYWKVDAHNLLHFLSLRADPHAQKEIRVYAEVLCDIVRQWMPAVFEAFEDYVMGSVTFSRQEIAALQDWIANAQSAIEDEGVVDVGLPHPIGVTVRERDAFHKALGIEA